MTTHMILPEFFGHFLAEISRSSLFDEKHLGMQDDAQLFCDAFQVHTSVGSLVAMMLPPQEPRELMVNLDGFRPNRACRTEGQAMLEVQRVHTMF